MPADLELALRVRADMREALRGIGTLNRSLGDTALRGDQAGAALTGATGAAQAFTTALGALGRESGSTLGQARDAAESVFGAMESALARFVTTGRVSFSGFVDSVIADLARLATRRYITQPLADLLFGALGGGATPGSAVFGREAGDPAGEAKNLAAVDFAPTALVENATHFAIMTAAAGGNVRAWGRLLNDQGQAATVSQQTEDDILRVPAGAVVVRIPAGT